MKLTAELVPSTVWYSSLYRLLPKDEWDRIRDNIIRENERRCQICGELKGVMNLHEIWKYDDINYVQKLDGFILLCKMCHHIKHIGLAGILASEGKLDYNDVVAHFCKVNGCSEKEFDTHVKKAFQVWKERSKHEWKQDFGEFEANMKEKNALFQE